MKRYRVLFLDFDARVNTLTLDIRDEWDEEVKELHKENQKTIEKGLVDEFGAHEFDVKRQNFVDLGDKPMSILAFHNRFFQQIRRAFVMGSYYPALTAACALGERILNYLILMLRDEFKNSEMYKRVYRKDSFDDWDLAIDTLEAWDILLTDVVTAFRDLKSARHKAIHFRPDVDRNDRQLSLDAIHHLRTIVAKQFGSFGLLPWFIEDTPGESFIRKDCEQQPFITKVYLPNCLHVGPLHEITDMGSRNIVNDDFEYEDREITDEEFRDMRKQKRLA